MYNTRNIENPHPEWPSEEWAGRLMIDWEKCPAVESEPGRVGGAWVFTGTRLPVSALFGNLAEGASIEELLDWFDGVEEWQVKAVLEYVVENLDSKVRLENPV